MNIEHPPELIDYLHRQGHVPHDETPAVLPLTGGVSNRTVIVMRASNEAWVLKQALRKLRVREDWFADPARIHREALGLQTLEQLLPAGSVPGFLFKDDSHDLLAMRAVPQPHENWKTLLLHGIMDTKHFERFGRMLGQIHFRSAQQREALEPSFRDQCFFEALRIEPYYRFTATRTGTNIFFDELIYDSSKIRSCLVHGDYSPKNVLVHLDQLVLLDHEVIHWGDPAFDLGFALTHLIAKAIHLPSLQTAFLESLTGFWNAYQLEAHALFSGPDFESRVVRHHMACMLARVDGRSPLEYLSEPNRSILRRLALSGIQNPPRRISDWFRFLARK